MALAIAAHPERERETPSSYRPKVLVVEREVRLRGAVSRCLEAFGCRVVASDTAVGALDAVERQPFDLAFVNPGFELELGRDLASRILEEVPGITLVLLESCAHLGSTTLEHLRGSCGHLPITFTPGQIKQLVDRFCEQRALRNRLADHERRLRPTFAGLEIVAESVAMRRTLTAAASAAQSDLPIVLRGESGSETESVARFIHRSSTFASGPFVSAIFLDSTDEDMATQLFGWSPGAGNGRGQGRPGFLEEAEGGTLFLGNGGGIPPLLYPGLQRLLHTKDFKRIGELRARQASVRIVAGTEDNPESSHGILGAVFPEGCRPILIDVPPLRERREDILPLARLFVEACARNLHKGPRFFTQDAQEAMVAYSWPGNIAELRNAVEYAAIHCSSDEVGARDLPECTSASSVHAPQLGGDFTLAEIEAEHIRRVAGRAPSEIAAAAILGICRSTLWRRRERTPIGCGDPSVQAKGAASPPGHP